MSTTERFEAPLPVDLTDELLEFWTRIFVGGPHDTPREAYLGNEKSHNGNVVYVARESGRLAGTCQVTQSLAMPRLGGLSQVATAPEFRGSGIATALCQMAAEEFRRGGGTALFLGTGNPAAARVYHRLGWRKLASANVMANVASGESPEAFLVDYFRGLGPAAVSPASARERVPMIPLLLVPHDWHVLDANAGMYSTRYCVQRSCMGLYRRYAAVGHAGLGAWFSARTSEGHVVGLSSARLDGVGECQVDGFAASSHPDSWQQLIEAAIEWSATQRASRVRARLSVEDEEKRSLLESLGFRDVSEGGAAFDLDGRTVESIKMERVT
jgi:GNAT superfamily N-acetyltransferase